MSSRRHPDRAVLALDHLFVCCAPGAPEADALARIGLTEGSSNTHPGQGTACRRFFFANAYLELIWVEDAGAAQAEAVRPTRLWERWSQRTTGVSPFGVVFRPADPAAADGPPFECWSYRPGYFPDGVSIEIATGTPLAEPEIFYFRAARRPDALGREPITHPNGLREITGLRIAVPNSAPPSAAARAVESRGVVSLAPGDAAVATLTFDHGLRGRVEDLRPILPLALHT